MLGRLSLRARLLLGVVALAAVGLTAADVATYSSLRSFLIHRTDSSLNDAHHAVEGVFSSPRSSNGGPGFNPGGPNGGGGPSIDDLTASVPGDYVQLRYLNGAVVSGKQGFVPQFAGGASGPKPKLPPLQIRRSSPI